MSNKIQKFDNTTLKQLRTYLNNTLKSTPNELGVLIECGNIRYSSDQCTVKLTVTVTGDKSAAQAKKDIAKTEFENNAIFFNADPKWFGKTFTSDAEEFKIVGLKVKARRYPILAESLRSHQVYKFPVSQIRSYLAQS